MSLPCSYSPNYFCIQDILATQERATCKFLQDVPRLGKLNSASEGDDLKAGTVLELPLWLGQELSAGRQPVVSLDLPKIYKEAYREILKADPCAVDLHKLNLYFFELGSHVKHLDSKGDVQKALLQTFQLRFRKLMDLAENGDSDPNNLTHLDMLERGLFKDAFNARTKLNAWLVDSNVPLETATMVMNHKKRKRIDFEDKF